MAGRAVHSIRFWKVGIPERGAVGMASNPSKPSLRRALDAFFLGFGNALNVSGSVVNRGRYSRGLAGDARALAGDWQRSLSAADQILRATPAGAPKP
jgi:hypothetical protein